MITRRSSKSCSPVCRQNTVSRCNDTTKTMSNIAYHQTPTKDVDDVDDDVKGNDPSGEDILAPKALFQEQHESSLPAFFSTCIVAGVVGGSTLLGSLFGGIWLSFFLCSASTGCMATISAQQPRAIEAKLGTYKCMSQRFHGGKNLTSIIDQFLPRRSRSLSMERGSKRTSCQSQTLDTTMKKTTTTSSDGTVWSTVDSNLPRSIQSPSDGNSKSKSGTETTDDDGTVWLTVDSISPSGQKVTTPTISNTIRTIHSCSAPTMMHVATRTSLSRRLSLQLEKARRNKKIHASTSAALKKMTKHASSTMSLPPPMYPVTTTCTDNASTIQPDIIWCQTCKNPKAEPTTSIEMMPATRTTSTLSRRLYLQLEKARRNNKIRDADAGIAFTKKKHAKHDNITIPLPPPVTANSLLNNDESVSTRQQSGMMMLWCQPCNNPKSGPTTGTSTTLMSATTTTSTLTRSKSSRFITTTVSRRVSLQLEKARRISLQLEKARRNKIRVDSNDSTADLKKKKTTSKKTTNSTTNRIPLPPPMFSVTWTNNVATNNANVSKKHQQEQHSVQDMWCQPCNKEIWCLPCTPTIPPALTTVGTF